MADSINDMTPVYDATGNLVNSNSTQPMSYVMPPPTANINITLDDSTIDTTLRRPLPCTNWVYSIKGFRVQSANRQHGSTDPWYDYDIALKYPDISQNVCQVWVDIQRQCCDTGAIEDVGTALAAESKQMTYWDFNDPTCPPNHARLKVKQFIFDEDLSYFFENVFIGDRQKLASPDAISWGFCNSKTTYDEYIKRLTSSNTSIVNLKLVKNQSITSARIQNGKRVNSNVNWQGSPYNTSATRNIYFLESCDSQGPCEQVDSDKDTGREDCVEVTNLTIADSLDRGNYSGVTTVNTSAGRFSYLSGGLVNINSVRGLLEYAVNNKLVGGGIEYGEWVRTPNGPSYFGATNPPDECLEQEYQVYTETRSVTKKYPVYKICYVNNPNGLPTVKVETVVGNHFTEIGQESRTTDPQPIGRPRLKKGASCCEGAQFFGGMPPMDVSRLEFDMTSAEWVLIDSCACEEVYIADVYCWYNDQKVALIHKKDIRNPITHLKKREVVDSRCGETETGVYHPFDKKKDIILGKQRHITKGLFNRREHMDCYLTSSVQLTETKKYYYDVKDCENCDRDPYFAIAYGNVNGSGSTDIDGQETNKTPSDSIYSQYQLICDEKSPSGSIGQLLQKFSFVSQSQTVESDDIYVINFYRNGLSDRLDPGNFQINLAYLSGSFYANNVHTGSNVKVGSPFVMSLIDDSDEYSSGINCDGGQLISYNIVSGTLTGGIYQDATVNSYGKVYPQMGLVILHPKRLNELLGFNTVTGSNIEGDNAFKLFTAISGAASPTTGRTDLKYLTARNITYKTTAHYFVRVYPHQSNYSNNPTFVTGSHNGIFDKCFFNDPTTYITSVGLYDSDRQLIGLAKLSRPIKKTFDTDLVIKIRLNW